MPTAGLTIAAVREVLRTIEFAGDPGRTERAFGWEVPLEARPGPRGPRRVMALPFERQEERDRFVAAVDRILGDGLGLDEGQRLKLGVSRMAALSAVAQLGDDDDAQAAEVELCSYLGDGPAEGLSMEAGVVLDDILAAPHTAGLARYVQEQGQGLER